MPGEERPRAPKSSAIYFVDVTYCVKATSYAKARDRLASRMKETSTVKVRRQKLAGKTRASWRAIRHDTGEAADAT